MPPTLGDERPAGEVALHHRARQRAAARPGALAVHGDDRPRRERASERGGTGCDRRRRGHGLLRPRHPPARRRPRSPPPRRAPRAAPRRADAAGASARAPRGRPRPPRPAGRGRSPSRRARPSSPTRMSRSVRRRGRRPRAPLDLRRASAAGGGPERRELRERPRAGHEARRHVGPVGLLHDRESATTPGPVGPRRGVEGRARLQPAQRHTPCELGLERLPHVVAEPPVERGSPATRSVDERDAFAREIHRSSCAAGARCRDG